MKTWKWIAGYPALILVMILATGPGQSVQAAEFATSVGLRAIRTQAAGTTTAVSLGWQGFMLTGSVEFFNSPLEDSGMRFYGGIGLVELGMGTHGPSARARMFMPLMTESAFLGRNDLYFTAGYEKFFDNDDLSGVFAGLYLQMPY